MPEGAGSDLFGWHPEVDLLDISRPGSRAALERLGSDTWDVALDYGLVNGKLTRGRCGCDLPRRATEPRRECERTVRLEVGPIRSSHDGISAGFEDVERRLEAVGKQSD